MTPNRRDVRVFLLPLTAALGISACSSGNSPTSPGNPSNGGALLNLGPFAVGESASFTFPAEGVFPYHCIAHRSMGMRGIVRVDSTGSDSVMVQIAANGFAFVSSTSHIKPGGQVRWVNASNLTNHTVTGD